jgi:hypothetical protein
MMWPRVAPSSNPETKRNRGEARVGIQIQNWRAKRASWTLGRQEEGRTVRARVMQSPDFAVPHGPLYTYMRSYVQSVFM